MSTAFNADEYIAGLAARPQLDRIEAMLQQLLRALPPRRGRGEPSGAAELLDRLKAVGDFVEVDASNSRSALALSAQRRGWRVSVRKGSNGAIRVTAVGRFGPTKRRRR